MSKQKGQEQQSGQRGYGNIYTPHAGSMIIQVQREAGLANRTIILSNQQVRLLRLFTSRAGLAIGAMVVASWVFFAVQAARVPLLTRRITTMERDALRLDTLTTTLGQLQARYEQVSSMLGAPPMAAHTTDGRMAADTATPTVPAQWPLADSRFVTRGAGGATPYNGPHPGVDIAVPIGTEVRAAGGGVVVEVGADAEYGNFLRITHAGGYETLYGHLSRVLVDKGARVPQGSLVALTGNTGRSTAPHLHFEVRHDGQAVDPLQLFKKGS
jgi:murein DD-endopeptidase MepM/ murein hydrolase activator NlpD